ncbi:MAG: hypothetical protein ABIP61_08805, partial [Burkholderiaceae bacterium]
SPAPQGAATRAARAAAAGAHTASPAAKRALADGGVQAPRSNLCVAIQAPVMRMNAAKARQWLPALRRAASALGRIDADAPPLATKARAG